MSYSWDDDQHQSWVREFTTRLRADGVDATLDQWSVAPGDALPEFMERAVRENDFVLIICTPRYKEKSDDRRSGVGYEGDIMTGEILTVRNLIKFIPILRKGQWADAAPSWLLGKCYSDLRGETYSEDNYRSLLNVLYGSRPQPPPLGSRSSAGQQPTTDFASTRTATDKTTVEPTGPIHVRGLVEERVGTPRNDGTRGCALYAVPFGLSRRPSPEWAEVFRAIWDHPPRFTSMHRPGIARVVGDQVILDGTTMDEIEKYHLETLKLVVEKTNRKIVELEQSQRKHDEWEKERLHRHSDEVRNITSRLKFD